MERNRCTCRGDLKRFMIRSRRRVGWWEFSARLLRPLCCRCSTPGMISRLAAAQLRSLSVISTRGARPCFFSSLRNKRLAAFLSRRLWTRTSRTKPSWSTARQSQCFLPAMVMTTSSRCHLSPRRGARRRMRLANSRPNFRPHWRIVSYVTEMPRAASISSTMRRLNGNRGTVSRLGVSAPEGHFRVWSLIGSGRVAWTVRLVKTGADGEEQWVDVMQINRADDLGDIANLGLTLAEGKLVLAGLQREIVAGHARGHAVVCRPDGVVQFLPILGYTSARKPPACGGWILVRTVSCLGGGEPPWVRLAVAEAVPSPAA